MSPARPFHPKENAPIPTLVQAMSQMLPIWHRRTRYQRRLMSPDRSADPISVRNLGLARRSEGEGGNR
jgi:hypothetical protein